MVHSVFTFLGKDRLFIALWAFWFVTFEFRMFDVLFRALGKFYFGLVHGCGAGSLSNYTVR